MQATRSTPHATSVAPATKRLDVPFLDLKAQNRSIWGELQDALDAVTTNAHFILGPAVDAFEKQFAEYVGVWHCVGLNNGTSALHLALLAAGVQRTDRSLRRVSLEWW